MNQIIGKCVCFIDFTQYLQKDSVILHSFPQCFTGFVTYLSISGNLSVAVGKHLPTPVEELVHTPLHPSIQNHARSAQGHPKRHKRRADLAQNISRLTPVVPDREIPVYQQPCHQLHRRNRACTGPNFRGNRQFLSAQSAQQKEAHSPCPEHADMAASTIKQFQSYISAAAKTEQSQILSKLHNNHLPESIPKKISKKSKKILDKLGIVRYTDEADFGGARNPLTTHGGITQLVE